MRDSTLPELAERGGLDGVEFVYVDVDRNPELMTQLARGRSIPQLICFEKKSGKWSARHLIGGQNAAKVAAFLAGDREEGRVLPASWTDWTRIFSRQ